MTPTRLTEHSHGAGCACKLSPVELSTILGPVSGHPAVTHPDLLVGIDTGDDAGVFELGDGRALVQTVDIFTPVVDSPTDWGRIAAANALSDIYAMGATPLTSLQFLAWPRGEIEFSIATEVIAAGLDKMAEAACTVVGGHSIDGPEPTYGFAVTGTADRDGLVTNAGAKPDDVLVLTKPLGIGIITTAIKRAKCPVSVSAEAIQRMATLNDIAGAALHRNGANAATDVTGFGLVGHLREMCDASRVGAEIVVDSVPLIDGTRDLLDQGMWAGGSQRNLESIAERLVTDVDVETWKPLIDAQTSGGLLVSLPAERVDSYVDEVAEAVVVGRVIDGSEIRLV